jgi:hypothetical protein
MALSDDLRQAAAECLDIAQSTADPDARTRLLTLAQKFMEISQGGLHSQVVLSQLLAEFNEAQMLKQ